MRNSSPATRHNRDASDDPALSTKEAALYLGGIHVKTLVKMARDRRIEFIQAAPGGAMKFRRSALNAYLERYTTRRRRLDEEMEAAM